MIDRFRPFMLNGLRTLLVDRGVLFADFFIATGVAFFIQFLVWTTIYVDGQEIKGFTFDELMYYCAFTILLTRLNNCYDLIEEMANEIIEGRVEVHMARPVNYLVQKFASYLGGGGVYAVPVVLLCLLYWHNRSVGAFQSVGEALSYGLLIVGFLLVGTLLSFCIGIIFGMLTFWLMQADFVLACLTTVVAFLGGAIIPPSFWPAFVRPMMEFNPFQFFVAAPAILIVGRDVHAGAEALGVAALYVAALLALIRAMWRRAINTYAGGGG